MIKDRFSYEYAKLEKLIWINSSCCKLEYQNEDDAKIVLKSIVADP